MTLEILTSDALTAKHGFFTHSYRVYGDGNMGRHRRVFAIFCISSPDGARRSTARVSGRHEMEPCLHALRWRVASFWIVDLDLTALGKRAQYDFGNPKPRSAT